MQNEEGFSWAPSLGSDLPGQTAISWDVFSGIYFLRFILCVGSHPTAPRRLLSLIYKPLPRKDKARPASSSEENMMAYYCRMPAKRWVDALIIFIF